MILPCQKDDFAPFIIFRNISRFINFFGIIRIQRVLDKGFCRFFRVIIVAKRKTSATHAKLTAFALCRKPVPIQNEYIRIAAAIADWQRLIIRKFPVYNIIGAVHRCFRRAIDIRKHGIGIFFSPLIELLGRHCLAAEHNLLQIGGLEILQRPCIHHNTQCRRHPVDIVNLLFLQIFQKLFREGKKHLRDNFHLCARFQHRIQILYRGIKIKRCLIADDFRIGNGKRFCVPFRQIHNSLVADDNALGYPC